MPRWRLVKSATDEYQVLESLRVNRQKRNRENAFIVEGVRNINAALAQGWVVRDVLAPIHGKRSAWAEGIIATATDAGAEAVGIDTPLFAALTDREETPEILLVVEKRRVSLDALPVPDAFVATVLDRPANPGNVGTMLRSSDALGGAAMLVLGHGADPYDPQSIRASTGSFFAVPVVEVAGVEALTAWAAANAVTLVATDESGGDLDGLHVEGPLAVLFGNETKGLSRSLIDAAHATVAVPMTGTASSLNVAATHAIVMHEIYVQRHGTNR